MWTSALEDICLNGSLWRLYAFMGSYTYIIWACGCCIGASEGFKGQLYALRYKL